MSRFRERLARHRHDERGRRWLFVPYDQLSDEVGPLAREAPRDVGIVLVECPAKAARRPYHRQKIALVLANLRHFALEQAARGVAVRHVVAPSYVAALATGGPLEVMRPAERELRVELAPLVESGKLRVLEHEGWLTEPDDFRAAARVDGDGRLVARMDVFYRRVRKRLGVLMQDGKPLGGRFSFDGENRKAWSGDPPAPSLPTFEPDEVTAEVCELVRTEFARHPGVLRPESLPATRADAERAWQWAKRECLPRFGPFEDAMSARERTLFHTRLSPLINLLRLPARRVLDEALAMDLPLASLEGFVRQVLGWREFMRHVHDATDGLRELGGERARCAKAPGDGGWSKWRGEPWRTSGASDGDGGSLASALGGSEHAPPAYWGAESGLRCLDEVVRAVWDEGYSHHITRLMVLANIATLLDVAPRELADWFWAAYTDAYDWVVEPNVIAMGAFGAGDAFTTKPYVSGAAYVDRMSDYCRECRFDPRQTCPLTPMYWAFLGRRRAALERVERMKLPLAAEAKRTAAQRAHDVGVFEHVRAALRRGDPLPAPPPSKPTKRARRRD